MYICHSKYYIKPMKNFFTTIFATALCATSLMAQEDEGSFSFYRNGQLVPNGSTVTISEYEAFDLGGIVIVEMSSGLTIKNNLDSEASLQISATGIDNFSSIQVCPGGNCIPWNNDGMITSQRIKIAAEAETDPQCHISGDFPAPFSYTGSITLTVCDYYDDEDCSTITVVFDTNGNSIKGVKNDKALKCEVFNLCGKKIANSTSGLNKGVYIIKQNGTSRKIVIK